MRLWIVAICAALISASSARAVTPTTWDHAAEADFAKGEFKATVLSSLGEISLARQIKILMTTETAPAVVTAVARIDKTVYVASGVEPLIYKLVKDKAEKLVELPGAMVGAMIAADGDLLAGVAGQDGAGVYRITPKGQFTKLWSDPDVKYVWAIVPGIGDELFVATGPQGKVFALDTSKTPAVGEVLYEAGKLAKNVLCLTRSAYTGLLYAGTDEDGLVVEINPRKKTSRVILDASEKEISALIADKAGGLYVATGEAAKARGDGKAKPNKVKAGKAAPTAATAPAPEPAEEAPSESDADQAPAPEELELPAVKAELAEMAKLLAEPHEGYLADLPGGQSFDSDLPPTEDQDAQPAETNAAPATQPTTKPSMADEPAAPKEESSVSAPPAAPKPKATPSRPGKGNAVYYVRPDGLVETRFRRPVTILAMLMHQDRLYLGTGNGGVIYSVSLDGDLVSQLADTEAAQITAMVLADKGQILFATANEGSVGVVSADLSASGTFISEALDAKQIAQWGTMRVWAQLPSGTKITAATRSGNVAKADDATWSSWSKEQPANGGFLTIGSPTARFLQYRLTLTGEGNTSPVAQRARIIHQVGNLAPSVTAVTVTASQKGAKSSDSAGGAKAFRNVKITASDPNDDKLSYTIWFRQIGATNWIQIAKDLTKTKYVWDTRTVGDGDYQIRVRASDSPDNPPARALAAERISDPVLVDNTAPVVKDLGARPDGKKVIVRGSVIDAGSRIASAHYAVDSQEKWIVLAATDGIYDSNRESFKFTLTDLKPGPHRIAVKVADIYGNVVYTSITATAGPAKD